MLFFLKTPNCYSLNLDPEFRPSPTIKKGVSRGHRHNASKSSFPDRADRHEVSPSCMARKRNGTPSSRRNMCNGCDFKAV